MGTGSIRKDWIGRVIDGKFTLLGWLGGTDSSGVFLTELPGPRRQKAAIKIIPATYPHAEARIADWATTAHLSHPHLMRLLYTGRDQIDTTGLAYSVTEYAEEVLSEVIAERALTPNEAKEMLVPILDALFYVHGKGFVHGHLKPSNIMVVGNQLKLTGDNLEVAGGPGKHFKALGVYDAPEIATGKITRAADVWSLGVTLVEVLTQQPPVWDRTPNKEPIVPDSLPQPLAGIVQGCLQLDPARRCTLSDVNKARQETARPLPDGADKTNEPATTGSTGVRRSVIAIVATVVVLVALIAALHLRPHRTAPSIPVVKQQVAPAVQEQTSPAVKQKAEAPVRQQAAPVVKERPLPAIPETPRQVAPPPTPIPKPAPGQAMGAGMQASNSANSAVVEQVLPDVAESASRTIRGTVRVRVRVAVDPSGSVSNATFESAGPSKYFANLALQAAQSWKFKPQTAGSAWILQFDFTQAGTEATPIEVSP